VGRIRPFTPDDIPAVVALRRQAFRRSEQRTAEDLARYFGRIFFGNPWRDEALPSLVYCGPQGRISGFLGVVPRPALFEGQPVRVAVGTQLMVDPAARGLAGFELMKAFLTGPQDLSLSDVANDLSRRMWEALGGATSFIHSLQWTQPVRRGRFYAGRLAGRLHVRGLALALRPASWAVDAMSPRPVLPEDVRAVPLTPALIATRGEDVLSGIALRPRYDERSISWLFDQLACKRALGALSGVFAQNAAGAPIGWGVYYSTPGGIGHVVQIAAAKELLRDVFECLRHDAWERGLAALTGRVEPALLAVVGSTGARIEREGPWVLLHSARPELVAAIHAGDAFLSRLEGEWWMCF
jgi:hypothetical protein